MTAQVDQFPYDEFEVKETEADDGSRQAAQPEGESKEFNITPYLQTEGKYDFEVGLFCETWGHLEHNNTSAVPNPKEILDGLKLFFDNYIDE